MVFSEVWAESGSKHEMEEATRGSLRREQQAAYLFPERSQGNILEVSVLSEQEKKKKTLPLLRLMKTSLPPTDTYRESKYPLCSHCIQVQ